MNNKVLFFGALGSPKKTIVGGGETGNLRTIKMLETLGFDVIKIYKPYPKNLFFKYFLYFFSILSSISKFYLTLYKRKKEIKFCHVAGFYSHLIYYEYILVTLSKVFKKRTIYEIKGGGMDSFYINGSALYRFFFRSILKKTDIIMSQGLENKKLINEILKTKFNEKFVYYPNYIENVKLPNDILKKKLDENLNLIYFGRISRDKNINLIISCLSELIKCGYLVQLNLIGNFIDKIYENELLTLIEELNLTNFVNIFPPSSFTKISKYLEKAHFFIFPSVNKREGHSNSLTEAMAYGVVPISSNTGFNVSVINNNKLILNEISICHILKLINKIINDNSFNQYSVDCQNRVRSLYCEEKAKENLKFAYYGK
jgi:glycosyltransferase involved in cell wall biosynthesis